MTATTKITGEEVPFDIVAQLDDARDRVDFNTELLARGLDLLELLHCGLDLDDMVDEVDAFKREVAAHKRMRARP